MHPFYFCPVKRVQLDPLLFLIDEKNTSQGAASKCKLYLGKQFLC